MPSLPELPALEELENNFNTEGNYKTSSSVNKKEKHFQAHLDNTSYLDKDNDNILMLNGELAEEYHRIKRSYRDLIQSFEQSLQRDMQLFPENNSRLERYRFRNLSDFESSVANGFLNLDDYTSKEINDLIKELNELENNLITRDLDEYNFKTIDDFQNAVDNGIIDLSRYEMKEINNLLNKLEDEELSINDYEIEMFGNLKLPDIEEVLNTKEKPVQKKPKTYPKQKLNKKPYYAKEVSLPSLPKNSADYAELKAKRKTNSPPKHIYEEDEKNIEDLLDDNIFKRFTKWFKNIINNKRGP